RLCIAGLLMLSSGTARAQFDVFYPGYPQSVVYPGSTPQGDWARGLGFAAFGLGVYNLNTAAGGPIQAHTRMRLNPYIYQSTPAQARLRRVRMAWENQRRIQAREQRYQQLVDRPEPADIYRGDTLNALFWSIAAMQIQHSAQRASGVTLPGGSLDK